MRPTIEVITMWYMDSFLAPFFLKHYSYADRIRVIIDADTEDKDACETAIRQYPNATYEYFKFPNGYSIQIRQDLIYAACNKSRFDWVIVPDSDEFIFCDDMHKFLEMQTDDIVRVRLYQVFRHKDDADLDPTKPVKEQRKHGDPNYVKGANAHGTKPIVIRTGCRVHLMPGNHGVWNLHRHKVSKDILIGQHWQMADPCFCVPRRMSRRKRFNAVDIPAHFATHDRNVTEEYIIGQCNAHLNDEEVPS